MKICKAEPHVSGVSGSCIVDVSALFIVACLLWLLVALVVKCQVHSFSLQAILVTSGI